MPHKAESLHAGLEKLVGFGALKSEPESSPATADLTRSDMKKKQQDWRRPEARVNLYLPHETVREIDREARKVNLSRSRYIKFLHDNRLTK